MNTKFNCFKLFCVIAIIFLFHNNTFAQAASANLTTMLKANPWKESELMEPATLAKNIDDASLLNTNIFNIGAVEDIKGAIHIGAVNNPENLAKLVDAVALLPKGKQIIIYCGCCPFAKCPNIRPAFNELKKLGFTNIKLLDLPVNLHTNWIAKGFPLAAK